MSGGVIKNRQVGYWPDLPWEAWQDTCATLHRWMQIAGKIRLMLTPMLNHWWQVAFYITPGGFTTSAIPYQNRVFQIDFDFVAHLVNIRTDQEEEYPIAMKPRTVADFYEETMEALDSLDLSVSIWTTPVEVEDRTPFEQDNHHSSYDREYAERCWRVMLQTDRVMKQFRSGFIGKASPVHFFWGAFDQAVTRFSGRRAPRHPKVPNLAEFVAVEAYSHEVSSCGFWPGAGLGKAAFYAYSYPEPKGFKDYPVLPEEAYYHPDLHEFILPYEAVRTAAAPDEKLLSFFHSAYAAAAELGNWDRTALEHRYQERISEEQVQVSFPPGPQ
jgi:hypothetical protein